ncbi:hypothetical protein C0J52_09595 [Blattella germanica]|nr:hypothetical protein C0J52_09595 [Blattella germanica]
MEAKSKRIRGINFTSVEKAIFVDILPKYVQTVEIKRTDSVSNQQKELCWEAFAKEYNLHPLVSKRTIKQLKVFYDGFKRQCRKNEKADLKCTAIGLSNSSKNDETSNKLLSLLKRHSQPLKNSKNSEDSSNNELVMRTEDKVTESFIASSTLPFECAEETLEGGMQIHNMTLPVISAPFTSPTSTTKIIEDNDEILRGGDDEVDSHASCTTTNHPSSVKRKQSESVIAKEKIYTLLEKRNSVIDFNKKLLEHNKAKYDALIDLKMAVQKEKLMAYQAKRLYYESKTQILKNIK